MGDIQCKKTLLRYVQQVATTSWRIHMEFASPTSSGPLYQPITTAQLNVQTFGAFRCHLDRQPITAPRWRTQRTIDLFLLLLTHAQMSHRRDYLCDTLWPDLSHEAAHNNLRVSLFRLKQVFSPHLTDVVRATSTTISLHLPQDAQIDVDIFAQAARRSRQLHDEKALLPWLRQAVNVYHGEFMHDQPVTEWNHLLRIRFFNEYSDMSIKLGHILLRMQRYDELIERMWHLLNHDHSNTEARQLLMLAYQQTPSATRRPPLPHTPLTP
jgi:DNA-binding SARP family transcriptional activator